jgi:hypothetical protein
MYRDGIACVARRVVTRQIGQALEYFKVLFFAGGTRTAGFARCETQKLELPHR